MSRAKLTTALLCVLALIPVGATAGFKSFLKEAVQDPNAKKDEKDQKDQKDQKKETKTEDLIFGGLKTIQSMMPIGYKEEMAIGGAVAVEAVARYGGLWQNSEAVKYLATVGTAVAQLSDRPDIPYYFGVLNTEEPNAFACPGGYIFVSKGLLKLVRNEAELGGILGHEIAHVAKKHALNVIRRSKTLGSASEVTLTALDQDPKMFDNLIKETVNLLFDTGLSQEDEREADRVGTEYAFRIGYRPSGLEEFLGVLGAYSGSGKSKGVFKTHPSPGNRIANLKAELRKPEYQGSATLPILAERWQKVRAAASL